MKLSQANAQLNAQLKTGNWNFRLDEEGNIIKGSFKDKIRSLVDSNFKKRRYDSIANFLTKELDALEDSNPSMAKDEPAIIGARRFRKRVPSRHYKSQETCKKLEKLEFLKRLGVTEDQINHPSNEGFYKWAKSTRVDSSLAYYNHTMSADDEGALSFDLGTGVTQKWSDVRLTAESYLEKAKELKDSYRPQFYSQDGLIFRDRFTFSEPYIQKKNPGTGRYLFRINIHAKKPGMSNNHLWWQYEMPDGSLYSFSKYRKNTKGNSCGVFPGDISHNETADTWASYAIHNSLEFEITQEQFEEMLNFEVDLANSETPVPFHNFYDNCTSEALRRLSMLGVDNAPDARISFWRVYAPKWIVKPCLKVNQKLPKKVSKVAQKIVNVGGNFTSLLFEGHKIDPIYKRKGIVVMDPRDPSKPIRAHIGSLKQLFTPDQHLFTSPYFVSKVVLDDAKEWREKEKATLVEEGASMSDILNVDFRLPPSWFLASATA